MEANTVETTETLQEVVNEPMEQAVSEEMAKELSIKTQVEDLLQQYGKLKLLTPRGSTLVKGFRNEKTILPVALLQNRIEQTEENVDASIRQIQQALQEQMQYMFQYLNKVAESTNTVSSTLEALTEITGVSEETLEVKVNELKVRKQVEAEAKADEQQNRVVVDRAAQEGDTVKITFVGRIEGKEFSGGKGENYHLKLGGNQFVPGFESQLVGAKAGETRNVEVVFPTSYGSPQLAGKAATFETTVLAVKETRKVE